MSTQAGLKNKFEEAKHGQDANDNQTDSDVVVDYQNWRITINKNISIEIVMNSITHETTEAITNAANSALMHGGGVAGRIREAGGPKLVKESNDWIKKHGSVPTGSCAYTSGGDLPH